LQKASPGTAGEALFFADRSISSVRNLFQPDGWAHLQASTGPGKSFKKKQKTWRFLFDLGKSPPYNPRPRCFAAPGPEVVFTVDFRREIRRRALFDIVI
jgi:hypothetical protein